MLTVSIYAPRLAKCISRIARPMAPRYPPAPIAGPGESPGTAMAASVVTPASDSSHPPARSQN